MYGADLYVHWSFHSGKVSNAGITLKSKWKLVSNLLFISYFICQGFWGVAWTSFFLRELPTARPWFRGWWMFHVVIIWWLFKVEVAADSNTWQRINNGTTKIHKDPYAKVRLDIFRDSLARQKEPLHSQSHQRKSLETNVGLPSGGMLFLISMFCARNSSRISHMKVEKLTQTDLNKDMVCSTNPLVSLSCCSGRMVILRKRTTRRTNFPSIFKGYSRITCCSNTQGLDVWAT